MEGLEPRPYRGATWRTTWASRDPLLGSNAGGRWHPPASFEALYTSLEADGSLAEVYHHLSRAPVFSSAEVRLARLRVDVPRVLRLVESEILEALGVGERVLRSMDQSRSREIGDAAYFLELDGLMVPSVRWPCLNLVLFPDRLDPGSSLRVEETREVNWPAWREAHAKALAAPDGPAGAR